MRIAEFQDMMRDVYFEKDSERGREGTFLWFVEEVGELAEAVRTMDNDALEGEFADVLAWLTSLANICEIDLTAAVLNKYRKGCPKCQSTPCLCR